MPKNCCGAWKDSQMSKWVYLRRSSWTYHQIRKMGPSKRYWQLAIRLEFEVCKIPSISSHVIYLDLPQAVISARINSDWMFCPKLVIPPEAKNYAWSHFGQIHPIAQKTVVREVSPDLHLIAPELHQVSPEFFFKKMGMIPLQFPLQNGWGRAQNKMDIQLVLRVGGVGPPHFVDSIL